MTCSWDRFINKVYGVLVVDPVEDSVRYFKEIEWKLASWEMYLIKSLPWSLKRMLSSDIQLPCFTVRQVSITILSYSTSQWELWRVVWVMKILWLLVGKRKTRRMQKYKNNDRKHCHFNLYNYIKHPNSQLLFTLKGTIEPRGWEVLKAPSNELTLPSNKYRLMGGRQFDKEG